MNQITLCSGVMSLRVVYGRGVLPPLEDFIGAEPRKVYTVAITGVRCEGPSRAEPASGFSPHTRASRGAD